MVSTPLVAYISAPMLLSLLPSLPALIAPLQQAPPQLGSWTADRAPILEPRGVTFLPDGGLAVVSRGEEVVILYDAEGQETDRWGAGELRSPTGIDVDDEGRLFVSDTGNRRVVVFDQGELEVFARTTHPGHGDHPAQDGLLVRPEGLDIEGDRIAIADPGNDRVKLMTLDGKHVRTLRGDLLEPAAVAFGDDEIFVADSGHHQIVVFDQGGKILRDFGDWGFFPGLFAAITDLEFESGHLYVCDAENHRVQVFTPAGELASRFGLHAIRPGEGRGKLHYPSALAIAPGGSLAALAEPIDDRVQLLGVLDELDPVDAMRQASNQPASHYGERLTVDGNHMVIVEPETHELQVFDLGWEEPRLIARLGGYGSSLGLFNRPVDAALDGESFEIFVVDRVGRALHHARLSIDPGAEVRFDPEMASWVKRLDFERLGEDLGEVELEAPVHPIAIELGNDELYVLDGRNQCVHVFGRDFLHRRTFGELRGGSDLAFDASRNRLWVVDRGERRVLGFSIEGELLTAIAELGDPFGLCVDGAGRLWISQGGAATGLQRIELAEEGPPRESVHIGSRGLGRVQFHRPRGLEVDGQGRIVVLDHGNHRVQWITPEGEYAGVFGARLYTKPARLPHTVQTDDDKEQDG